MSEYIEYNNKIAFHPGYYLKEIVAESGLTQEDFAKRLGTTPKNLSILIRGEQSLSIEMATNLSRMMGTTIAYWLNLQQAFDEKLAQIMSDKELAREREVFKLIDYKYFRDNFNLPALPGKIDEQIKNLREFLSISSLTVLEERNLSVNFRSYSENLTRSNIVNANAMVQIAMNITLRAKAPKYDKKRLTKEIEHVLTLTDNDPGFEDEIKERFRSAGVILTVLPNLKNSGINGATKRVDGKIMMLVSDRRHYADTFWFSLFHEIGHVVNGDLGLTFNNEAEDEADLFAQNMLIPQDEYAAFLNSNQKYDEKTIRQFAARIGRNPGIVFGRLQKDGKIPYNDTRLSGKLRRSYTFKI